MIERFTPIDVAKEAKLQEFRERTRWAEIEAWDQLSEAIKRPLLPYSARRGPGAASPLITLATLKAPVTKNTYTGPATNLTSDATGSFPLDYFNSIGANFQVEASGLLSTTVTPTIVFRFTFGTGIAAITTMLAQHAAITTVSGAANLDWYMKLMGVVRAASGTTSTILVTGFMLNQFATAAAGNNLTWLKNATPPTAVTCDLVTAGIFFDLQSTWSASSASNIIIVNTYQLQSEAV